MSKNTHNYIGSDFDDFLKEEGIFEECKTEAAKHVFVWQHQQEMQKQNNSKEERKEMPKCESHHHCKNSHEPNEETAQVLKESDKEENLIEYETLDQFWDALGFSKHP